MIFSKYRLNFKKMLSKFEKPHDPVPTFEDLAGQIKADYQVSISFRSMLVAMCLGEVNDELEKVMKRVREEMPIIRNLFDSMMIACEQPETAAFQIKNIMFQLEIEKSDLLFLASEEFVRLTNQINDQDSSSFVN